MQEALQKDIGEEEGIKSTLKPDSGGFCEERRGWAALSGAIGRVSWNKESADSWRWGTVLRNTR